MRRLSSLGLLPVSLLAVAGGLGGCVPALVMMEPEPHASVAFEPGDGTTAQGMSGRDLLVAVDDPGHLVDAASLADLAGRIFLRTWPEGDPLAATTEVAMGQVESQRLIRVTPGTSLEDRWYVLGFAELPPRVLAPATLPDGTIGARFRPGSHPRVAKVRFCDKEAPGMKLVVVFSEPITAAAPALDIMSLAVSGRAAACETYGGDAGALYFTCDELTPTASVRVSVGAGIAGASGVPLEPAGWDVELPTLPAGSCRDFGPPL